MFKDDKKEINTIFWLKWVSEQLNLGKYNKLFQSFVAKQSFCWIIFALVANWGAQLRNRPYDDVTFFSSYRNIFQIFVIETQMVECFLQNELYHANFDEALSSLALW